MKLKNTWDKEKNIVFYALVGTLFISPFFQGLFFDKAMHVAEIAIAIIFAWHLFKDGFTGLKKNFNVLDVGLVLILAAHIISTFAAVKLSTAIKTNLEFAVYLMAYLIVIRSAYRIPMARQLITVVYLSGVIVAIAGLAAYGGANMPDGIVAGRIASTFQYPNSLGAYMGAIGLLGCYLIVTTPGMSYRLTLAAANIAIFTALFGTASRGTFIVLPFAYCVYIFLQPSGYKIQAFGVLTINFLLGGATAFALNGLSGKPQVWVYIIIFCVVNVLVHIGVEPLLSLGRSGRFKIAPKYAAFVLVGILISGVLGGYYVLGQAEGLKRITDISLKDRNIVERGYFYGDALKIIKEHPIVGVGGGGWASIYREYQSYGYISKQVHNFYLQTWVEAGILGIFSLVMIIIGVIIMYIRVYRRKEPEKVLLATTVLAALMIIGMESAVDFTMAFGAVSLIVWTFFGILKGLAMPDEVMQTGKENVQDGGDKLMRYGVIAVSLLVAVLSFSFLLSIIYNEKSIAALKDKEYDARLNYLRKAVIFNPFDADHYANLAAMDRAMFKVEKKPEQIDSALSNVDKAIARNKGSYVFRVEKVNILLAQQDFNGAVREAEIAAQLEPWSQDSYELLGFVYLTAGNHYLNEGEHEKAEAYLTKAADMPKVVINKMKTLTEEEKKLWVATPHLSFTKRLQQYSAQAVAALRKLS